MASKFPDHHHYKTLLAELQLKLVEMQVRAMKDGERICIVLEGRDGAGKDGLIKRVTAHLSSRQTRVVALPKPTAYEETQWYFQRYVAHLPAAGEIVIFNRSWYNRGGVERVMKFSTPKEQEQFLHDAPEFERLLVNSGIKLIKIWLDIDDAVQEARLGARRKDPLKQLKVSDMDKAAQAHWKDYSRARDSMLLRTHTEDAPWIVVRADDKQQTRLNVIRDLLMRIPGRAERRREQPDARVVREFRKSLITKGWLAA